MFVWFEERLARMLKAGHSVYTVEHSFVYDIGNWKSVSCKSDGTCSSSLENGLLGCRS
jgi:hypothetical protein